METNYFERMPLDLSQLNVAAKQLNQKQFAINNGNEINAFAVYGVDIDTIIEEKTSHNVVVVIGKEIKLEGNSVFTLRNRYIVNHDFSFGKWAVGNETEKIEDKIISQLTDNGFINVGFNSEEIKDFLTSSYVAKGETETETIG